LNFLFYIFSGKLDGGIQKKWPGSYRVIYPEEGTGTVLYIGGGR
jgi:hypothetical protein